MVNNIEFSKRLHQVMEYHQLSAAAFADAIHVGRSSISHILSGRNKPSLEFVMKIIEAFPEVELYWLLNGTGNFPKTTAAAAIKKIDDLAPASESPVPILDKTPTDLFSTSADAHRSISENPLIEEKKEMLKNNRIVDRIVVFYADGSFDSYIQNKP